MYEIKLYRQVIQTQEIVVKCYSVEDANKLMCSGDNIYSKWTNISEPEVAFLPERTHLVNQHKNIDIFINDIVELYSKEEIIAAGYPIVNNYIEFKNIDFDIDIFQKFDHNIKQVVSCTFADNDFCIKGVKGIFPNELIKKIH